MARKPHIIIFNPDQFRSDAVAHLGNPASITPNLDRLAATEAVSFRNAYCQNPVCTPSRCSFMTGWYPHTAGHRTMHHMLRSHEPVLLKELKDAGYSIFWGGKNDLTPAQNSLEPFCDVKYVPKQPEGTVGFPSDDDWRGPRDGDNYFSFYAGKIETNGKPYWDRDGAYVDAAADWVRQYGKTSASDPDAKPICVYLPLVFPHPAYGVHEPYYSAIDRAKVPPRVPAPLDPSGKPIMLAGIRERQNLGGWTEDRWTELRATYLGMCMRVDDMFGQLVSALKDAGIYNNSAIFFFSDHGDYTGDYGLVEKNQNTFEDFNVKVPFLVKPPRGTPIKPRISNALVELTDFSETVYDLTGINPQYTRFGRSLLPVLTGSTDQHRDAVFCEGGRLRGEQHCKELESRSSTEQPDRRVGPYWPRISLQVQDTDHHGKAVMCRTQRYKYVRRLYEKDEFYDLEKDPAETLNRIDDPAYSDAIRTLRDRTLTFFMETGDVVPHNPDRRW